MARPRNNETREKILRCSFEKFSEKHYESISLKDIAAECGITATLLQHYYPSKADIVIHIVYDLLRKIWDFLLGENGLHLQLDAADIPVADALSIHLMFDVMSRNNNQLLRVYSYILCDAKLMNKIVDFCFEHLYPVRDVIATFKRRYGQYILFGGISQIVELYLNGKIPYTVNEAIDELYKIYYEKAFDKDKEQQEHLVALKYQILTKEVTDSFYKRYINSIDHFINCEW